MRHFKRLKNSRAAWNMAASYFAFGSTSVCAFLSIPLAVAHLDKVQIGLWTIVHQIVQYLVWMDLGVGTATGRKMADAVASGDKAEIDRWWTATRFCLLLQGILLILVGFLAIPFILDFANIPESVLSDARALLIGSILIVGLTLPMRGVPGLMTAQERFHWIPLMQGILPWINLAVFAVLLNIGFGVKSYLYAMAGTQLFTLVYFSILVRTSPVRPGWDREGLSKARFRSLFGYSLSLSATGLVEAIVASLPAILLARANTLGTVPLYSFTGRGPSLLVGLTRRTTHAFYPRLMRLYVEGKKEEFGRKFQETGQLTLSVALLAGGLVLTFNRPLVELLAGPEFYAGQRTATWFAIGTVILPLAGLFSALRQISGTMGMTAIFALLKLVVGVLLAIPMFNLFGLEGLAATFALVPLIDAAYGYVTGATNCGFRPWQLSGKLVLTSFVFVTIILIGGYLTASDSSSGLPINIFGRPSHLPNLSEFLAGFSVVTLGIISTISCKIFKKPAQSL